MSTHAALPEALKDRARSEARARALAKHVALRRGAKRIRKSVAGLALALFIAAFAGIYVQLASGHDPALAVSAQRRGAVRVTSGTSGTSQSTGAPSAVTTSQS
ncbi:MAG TPA: hypothetical protein VGL57_10710 [Solirubrobacteraceae bacterium]|jgi:hypothetical protein